MLKKIRAISSNGILKSTAGLLVITLLVKIFGYIEKLVLANYYGTSYEVDVYTVVLTVLLSIFFFFREIIEPGFLNVFLDAKKQENEVTAWSLFNLFIRLVLIATILISVFAIFFPNTVSGIFAPGFDGEKLALSNQLIRIAIPACIFLAISTLTGITLNGLKIFALPASGELVFKGVIILCMVLFYREYGIIGAAIGIVIGSAGRLGVHLFKLADKISFTKVTIGDQYKKRVWQLTWPLLLGVSFSQIASLADNMFASFLQDGAIAALSYSKKVVELPVIIFPYVLSIVVFPYFTQLAVEKNKEKLKSLLTDSLKWIVIAFIPIAVFFILYSSVIIEFIFQRGAFDGNSTMLTAKPLMVYSLGLVFFAIETILVIFYYANADTKTPVFVGMCCVVLHIILTWVFIQMMGYIGIALAYVIQKVIKNAILLGLLRQKINVDMKKVWAFLMKILISSAVLILIIFFTKLMFYDRFSTGFIPKVGFIGLSMIMGCLIYFICLWLFQIIQFNKVLIPAENNEELKQ